MINRKLNLIKQLNKMDCNIEDRIWLELIMAIRWMYMIREEDA